MTRFVHIVVFSGPFPLLNGNSWSIDGFIPVDIIGGNFGVEYLIVGDDILVVLNISPANFPL